MSKRSAITPTADRSARAASRSPARYANRVAPVLQALRAATAPAHRRLERRLPLTHPDLTHARYIAILGAYHGFYAPLEQRLNPLARPIPALDWPARRKTPLLTDDLLALGLEPAAIYRLPRCQCLPEANEAAQALGCLYVLEGATLGGQILSRLLDARLGIDARTGGAFLAAYGPATGRMWRRFIDCLARVTTPDDQARAVVAGEATFNTFEAWLEHRGVLS